MRAASDLHEGPALAAATRHEIEAARLRHGRSHISCFASDGQKRSFLVGDGAVGYQVKAGAAVALGDPLTSREHRGEAISAFLRLCATRGWAPCFYQADASDRDAYRDAGLRVVKFGEEAVVNVAEFDLGSPLRANARHEVARARRHGLEPRTLFGLGPGDAAWPELEDVSARWLEHHGGREMGFSLGRLHDVVDRDTWYTLACDGQGRVHAFCSWVRLGNDGLALDMVRRRPDAGPGAVDLCVVTGIDQARARGLARTSLGLVPLHDSLGDSGDGWLLRRLRHRCYRRGLAGYHYRSLAHFKAKFATHWEGRDVALPRGPRLIFAVMALVELHRGRPPDPGPPSPDLQPVRLG